MATNDPITFSVKVTGIDSKEVFSGTFKTKTRLSHREQLKRGELRRSLLGERPDTATPRELQQAEIFAEIMISVIDAPSWWKNADGGLDLEDDNVVAEVYEGVLKARRERLEALKKEAEEARAELKKGE